MIYFDPDDYLVTNNVVTRISSKTVPCKEKHNLLKEVLIYYTGREELPKLTDFEFIGLKHHEEDFKTFNCICSHPIAHVYFIIYKDTGIMFKIGSKCFETLYQKQECDDCYFFKPFCLNCIEKVKSQRSNAEKAGFCSKKCMNIYSRKFECIDCGKRYWRQCPSHKWCKPCWRKNTFFGKIDESVKYLIR